MGTLLKSSSAKKANWLLRSLVLISLGIHTVVFLHLAGVYRSRALTAIELTLENLSKEKPRDIPRPRPRVQPPPEAVHKETPRVVPRPMPSFEPLKADSVQKDLPNTLVERLSVPNLPATSSVGIADWMPPKLEGPSGDFSTAESYLEMVRLKIERHKKYPEEARSRQIEGRVTVKFVIMPEGSIRDTAVVKSSSRKALDAAALQAVQNASPFPRPPARFFKGPVPLTVTVVFELM